MRRLSDEFMSNLQYGFLAALKKQVIADKDLDLQIRNNYLNIYYKGNSLLRLTEVGKSYHIAIHPKFCTGLSVPDRLDTDTISKFLSLIPAIKDNVARYGGSSIEIEYEQMIIRANNDESRNNSEYFIVDRQCSINRYRFDLIGIYWNKQGRKRGQEVPLCLIEVKFALNSDIQKIDEQLQGYYNLVKERASVLAEEYEVMLHQKLELELFNQPKDRIEAMKTLHISPEISQFQFIVFLVDYNPYSKHLNLAKLQSLPFANQISIFQSGLAMWRINSELISTL